MDTEKLFTTNTWLKFADNRQYKEIDGEIKKGRSVLDLPFLYG